MSVDRLCLLDVVIRLFNNQRLEVVRGFSDGNRRSKSVSLTDDEGFLDAFRIACADE